jgi:hypothetical protein
MTWSKAGSALRSPHCKNEARFSGVAVIRVGGATEVEVKERKPIRRDLAKIERGLSHGLIPAA